MKFLAVIGSSVTAFTLFASLSLVTRLIEKVQLNHFELPSLKFTSSDLIDILFLVGPAVVAFGAAIHAFNTVKESVKEIERQVSESVESVRRAKKLVKRKREEL